MESNILWRGKANMDLIFSARRHDHYDNNASYIIYWLLIFHTKGNNRVELRNLSGPLVQICALCMFYRERALHLKLQLNIAKNAIDMVDTSFPTLHFYLSIGLMSVRPFIRDAGSGLVLSGCRTRQNTCPHSSLVSHSLWSLHQQSGATLTNVPS